MKSLKKKRHIVVTALWVMLLSTLFSVPTMAAMTPQEFFTLCASGTALQVSTAITQGASVNWSDPMGKTPLMFAAEANPYPDVVTVLTKAGAYADASDYNGWTALMYAVSFNANDQVTAALLKARAGVNTANNDGNTPLILAIEKGNIKVVQPLIQAGANVNAKGKSGLTPLQILVAIEPQIDIVIALINAGANVNVRDRAGNTPLMVELMRSSSSPRLVDILLKAGTDVNVKNLGGLSALMLELNTEGNMYIVKMLLHAGADINARDNDDWTPLMYAVRSGNVDATMMLLDLDAKLDLSTTDGKTALIIATERRVKREITSVLIRAGADVHVQDRGGWNALMYAAKNSDLQIVQELLEYGANVDRANKEEQTPLLLAVINRAHLDVVKALLYRGAYVNSSDKDGWTPLMYAAKMRSLDVADALISAGANLNMTNDKGYTVLHLELMGAANLDMLKLLIHAGADVNRLTPDGLTPLMYAVKYSNNAEITILLLHAGVEVNARENSNGMTALMIAAVENENQEIIFILLNSGADATMRDYSDRRVVDYLEQNTALKGTDAYWKLMYLEPMKLELTLEPHKSKVEGALLATVLPSAGHAYAGKWLPKGPLFLLGEAAVLLVAVNQDDPTVSLIGFGLLKAWEIYDVLQEVGKFNSKVDDFNKKAVEYNQSITNQ